MNSIEYIQVQRECLQPFTQVAQVAHAAILLGTLCKRTFFRALEAVFPCLLPEKQLFNPIAQNRVIAAILFDFVLRLYFALHCAR